MNTLATGARIAILELVVRTVVGGRIPPRDRAWIRAELRLSGFRKTVRSYLLKRMARAGLQQGQVAILFRALDTFTLACSATDSGVGWELLEKGEYEPHVTDFYRKTLRPGMCVADIGANIGFHALHAAVLVGEGGRVLAVEPDPQSAALLRLSLEVNALEAAGMRRAAGELEAVGAGARLGAPEAKAGGRIGSAEGIDGGAMSGRGAAGAIGGSGEGSAMRDRKMVDGQGPDDVTQRDPVLRGTSVREIPLYVAGPSGRTAAGASGQQGAALPPRLNVEVIEAALSDRTGEISQTDLGNAGNSGARFTHHDRGTLEALVHGVDPVFRMARAIRWDDAYGDVPIDLVKIDIEGYEPHAVRGMEDSIERYRPVILSEFAPSNLASLGGTRPEDYLRWFTERGYTCSVLEEGTARLISADAAAVMDRVAGRHHLDLVFTPDPSKLSKGS